MLYAVRVGIVMSSPEVVLILCPTSSIGPTRRATSNTSSKNDFGTVLVEGTRVLSSLVKV